jgi:hypothetical protein
MTPEQELLLVQATTAFRDEDADKRLLPSPAFFDLPADLRLLAHDETARLREMEAALDPRGLSTTGRAVLERIAGFRGNAV